MSNTTEKTLLICGAGHASLPLIKTGRQLKERRIRTVVLSSSKWLYYSGAVPQFMGGFLPEDQARIDVEQLCRRYGCAFFKGDAVRISTDTREVEASDRKRYHFDYLIINTGVKSRVAGFLGDGIYPVKPMEQLVRLRSMLEQGGIKKLHIAGGGPAGTELALNLSHPKSPLRTEIILSEKESRLLSGLGKRASRIAEKRLQSRGVEIQLNTPWDAESYHHKKDADAVIAATGNNPSSLSFDHPFPESPDGRLITDRTLQLSGFPGIFAAGDTARVGEKGYPPIGVHAVKQGVVLRHNIVALHASQKLMTYKPWPVSPLIISDGACSGILVTPKLTLSGRWAATLKYMLDMNWLEKYTHKPEDRRSWSALYRDGRQHSACLDLNQSSG